MDARIANFNVDRAAGVVITTAKMIITIRQFVDVTSSFSSCYTIHGIRSTSSQRETRLKTQLHDACFSRQAFRRQLQIAAESNRPLLFRSNAGTRGDVNDKKELGSLY